jgi:hypothetical protein
MPDHGTAPLSRSQGNRIPLRTEIREGWREKEEDLLVPVKAHSRIMYLDTLSSACMRHEGVQDTIRRVLQGVTVAENDEDGMRLSELDVGTKCT